MGTKDWAKMFERYAKLAGHTAVAGYVFDNLAERVAADGLTVCDIKPLAELLGCEPEMSEVERKTHQGVVLVEALRKKLDDIRERVGCDKGEYLLGRIDDLVNRPTPPSAAWYCAQVAQALNWERTEFETLDDLLEELREHERAHSNFVHQAIANDENMDAAFDKLCRLAEQISPVPMLLDDAIGLLSPDREPPCTHTLLHAGELYREVTILLHTDQLIAWRTADGQEYVAVASQVQLDPDDDGLAAAILSRIAGVEIAPEHMAELRAQMAGGDIHG